MLIAIDPGVQKCGVALFDDNDELCWAVYVGKAHAATYCRGESVVIEMPKAYRSALQKGDQNDLLNLAAVVGFLEHAADGRSSRVFPSEWKGQVPKKIMTDRILKKLTHKERERIVDYGSKTHNAIDAVGLGLWKLGRL